MSRFQAVLFAVLTAVSLTLLLLGPAADSTLSSHLAGVLLYPIRLVSRWAEYLTVSRNRIERLERDVTRFQLENAELRKQFLPESVQFAPTGHSLVKAHVIGRDPTNFNGFLYIDRVRGDSLEPGQPVISEGGLVGRVKHAGDLTSIVETIENRGLAVSAQDTRTGVHGIVAMDDQLRFEYVKIKDEVAVGDSVFTSGMSEQFPPGILIATIEQVVDTHDLLFKKIILRPCVSINRLNYVFVIRAEPPDTVPAALPAPVNRLYQLPIVIPPPKR